MNSLLSSDEDELERGGRSAGGGDREISLGTATLLGLFLALAIVCALFFGFGYTLGRHSAPPVAASTAPGAEPGASGAGGSAKPGAGSLFGGGKPSKPGSTPGPAPSPGASAPAANPAPGGAAAQRPEARITKPAATVTSPPGAAAPPTTTPTIVAAPVPDGTVQAALVQVAAVSHREDAELLVSTLKRRGYNVAINNEPGDKLLHVQIGPFPTHKEADAMRQKLLADGFNAIVK